MKRPTINAAYRKPLLNFLQETKQQGIEQKRRLFGLPKPKPVTRQEIDLVNRQFIEGFKSSMMDYANDLLKKGNNKDKTNHELNKAFMKEAENLARLHDALLERNPEQAKGVIDLANRLNFLVSSSDKLAVLEAYARKKR